MAGHTGGTDRIKCSPYRLYYNEYLCLHAKKEKNKPHGVLLFNHFSIKYLLCDSTYLLEHAVRLHLLTGVIRWLLACVTSCRWRFEARGLNTDDRVTILLALPASQHAVTWSARPSLNASCRSVFMWSYRLANRLHGKLALNTELGRNKSVGWLRLLLSGSALIPLDWSGGGDTVWLCANCRFTNCYGDMIFHQIAFWPQQTTNKRMTKELFANCLLSRIGGTGGYCVNQSPASTEGRLPWCWEGQTAVAWAVYQ